MAQLDISQVEVKLRFALDRTYISGIERGRRNATVMSIATLARALLAGGRPCYAAEYVIPRRSPRVLILPSPIRRFMAGRIVLVSVPSAAAICSPRWPGCFVT